MRLLYVVFALFLAGCAGPTVQDVDEVEPMRTRNSTPTPQAHVHDYFGSQATLTLMDAAVEVTTLHNHLFDEPPRDQHTHGCDEALASTSQGGTVKFSLPAGTIVPPGTQRLDVTAAWSDATITGIRLLYRPPAHDHGPSEGQHQEHGDFIDAGPMVAGRPVAIDVVSTMADQGHQFHSNWAFFLCAAGPDAVQLAQGTLHLTIVAHRAEEIPLDPPHPDRWQNRTVLSLGALSWSGQAFSAGNQGDAWFHVPLDEGAVVPWGTDHVQVVARLTQEGGTAGVLPADATLYYRDASSVEWRYDRVVGTGDSDERVFIIPIDKGEADDLDALDSPYADRTHWDFWIRVSSTTGTGVPMGGYWTVPHAWQGRLDVSVAAMAVPA